MKKRGDGKKWLSARRVLSVLVALAKEPLTPEQIRIKTGMTKCHYVNAVLKRLSLEKLVVCLNPDEKIGRVFCVDERNRRRVQRIFRRTGIEQKIISLPVLNWIAYGRLSCEYCRQVRIVLEKINELAKEDKPVIISRLRARLPGMATSDIYRASKRLMSLGIVSCANKNPLMFQITSEGHAILIFQEKLKRQTLPNSVKRDPVATPEWKETIALLKVSGRS